MKSLQNHLLYRKNLIAPDSQLKEIDNLGAGHCGYISYIIGAFHLVKNHQLTGFIERWKELDPEVSQWLDKALQLELDVLSFERDLIIPLNYSLRKILSNYYLQTLPNFPETKNVRYYQTGPQQIVFSEFSFLCEWAIHQKFKIADRDGCFNHMSFNLFWKDSHLKKIAISIAESALHNQIQIENPKILSIYLHAAMVQYRQSIQDACISWSKTSAWMTDSQALQLSEIFDVPVVLDPRKAIKPEKPFIHLNNHRNHHWTTLLYDAQYSYPFKIIHPHVQFRDLKNNYFNDKMIEYFENQEFRTTLIGDLKPHFQSVDEVFMGYIEKFESLKKYIQKPKRFSKILQEDPFYLLYRNCIVAKETSTYVANEYRIECLRLLMYIDVSNKDRYQSDLNECLSIRFTMDEHEQQLFQKFCDFIQKPCSMSTSQEVQIEHTDSVDIEDNDYEWVDQFLATTSKMYLYQGLAIAFVLSSVAAIFLLMTSIQLLPSALICIILASLSGALLGSIIDLMQVEPEQYSTSLQYAVN